MRKTAAICVAKLFDINPELVEDRGFIDQLRELLADSNPMAGSSIHPHSRVAFAHPFQMRLSPQMSDRVHHTCIRQ